MPCVTALAQDTGFNKTSGTHAYDDPDNWVNGEINGIWDPSLVLTNNLTVTFGADTALSEGLKIGYSNDSTRSITFRGNGGNYTLTLGGDILLNTTSNVTATIGSTGANQNLNVDLGGQTRTFNVVGVSGSYKTLDFVNQVSNGSLILTGGGKIRLGNRTNTIGNVTVNGADFVINGAATTSADTITTLTGALTSGPGFASDIGTVASTVTLRTAANRNTTLQADHFVRNAGSVMLFRGTNLGGAAFGTTNTANVQFTGTTPTLSGTGAAGTTTVGIIAGALGDTSSSGTGFGATGGLVTYDAATGVRLLTSAEYATTITSGQTQLDNVRLTNSSGSLSTTTLSSNTTINSLSLITSGTAGSGITLNGTGKLTISSGVIYGNSISPSNTSASAMIIANTIDLNGKEGIVLYNTAGTSGGTGGANLQLSGAITNDGGKGITFNGAGAVELNGTTVNTYTGPTVLNSGYLRFAKTGAGANGAIGGDLIVNGGTALWGTSNQIADTANITINGGTVMMRPANNSGSSSSEVFNDLTMNGGEFQSGSSSSGANTVVFRNATLTNGNFSVSRNNRVTLSGLMALSGARITIANAQSTASTYDTGVTLNGGLSIANLAEGAYTPIQFTAGPSATTLGGRILLASDLTFTGNSTNNHTVLISGDTGDFNNPGVIALSGTRTFNIGDGAAASDLTSTAPLIDAAAGDTGSLVKTGAGTLDLQGANTYTGSTTISAGTLLINGSSTSAVAVNNTGTLGGSGTISQTVTVNQGGVLAPGSGGLSGRTLNTGNLSFAATDATLALAISGSGAGDYSQLNVTGGVSLDGNGVIELTLQSFTPEAGDIFFVIRNDGSDLISGTFLGLAQGSTFEAAGQLWQISYQADFATGQFTGGNDLALMAAVAAVPEPQTWLLLGSSALALCLYRRRKIAA